MNIEDILDLTMIRLDDIPKRVYYSKSSTSIYVHTPCGTLSIRDHCPPYKVRRRLRWIIQAPCSKGVAYSILRDMLQIIDKSTNQCNNSHTRSI